MPKPRLLFADANAILVAHICGRWLFLCQQYEVWVTPIVIEEAVFYDSEDGNRTYIDLRAEITAGRVKEVVDVTATELTGLRVMVKPGVLARLDRGEEELLAHLVGRGDCSDVSLVTGDGPAIWVADGLEVEVISLEEALVRKGDKTPMPVSRDDATAAACKRAREAGKQKRTRGEVFNQPELDAWLNARPMP